MTLWNRASVVLARALPRIDERQRAYLEAALSVARSEASVEDAGPPPSLVLNRGVRRGALTPEVAMALARVAVELEPRMDWAASITARDLHDAWRMLSGGVVLGRRPAELQAAFEIACLVGAMVGRLVLVVTDGDALAERVGERLAAPLGKLGCRVAIMPKGASRCERRACYRANIVCVEASTLALDLLHDQPQSQRRRSPLLQRLSRLGASSPGASSESMLPGQPTLGLCRDAGAVLGDRALENHALWTAAPCHDEAALAEQALALADILRAGDHFTLPAGTSPPWLTPAGQSTLEAVARRRGGLLMNAWLREPAVERALLVRYRLKEGEDFAIADDGSVVPLNALLEEEASTPPGLLALLSCAVGKASSAGGVAAQARNQQLLAAGIERLGGMGLALPGLARELVTLHDLRVWHADREPCPAGRPEIHEVGEISQALPLVQEWRRRPSVSPGWVMSDVSRETLGIELDAPCIGLDELVDHARQGRGFPGFEAVTHVLLVLDESQDPAWWAGMLHERLPGLTGCRAVVMRPGLDECRRLATGPVGRWLVAWRHGRYLRRRLSLKRRVLQRDEAMHRLTQFHGDGGG